MGRMCGRYASASGRPELLEAFGAEDHTGDEPVEPDWNVAPTKPVPAVLVRRPRDQGTGALRQLRVLRWGLVPSWAKDPSIGSRLINARVETLADKPAFRSALSRRRCLLPADGYYEWYSARPLAGTPGAKGRPSKQPFFLSRRDGGLLVMAGLYEVWADAEGRRLWTAAVVTGDAADELGHIHDRSPVLVDEADRWLDPSVTDAEAVLPLLRTARPGELRAWAVSTEVNNVANNGPQLLAPLPPQDVPPPVDLDAPGLF
jgi:putative SOS response-associated peptidase YedK